jgi:hypothetical protein
MTFKCEECKTEYKPRNGGKKQKYCSGACRRKVALRNLRSRQALELSERIEKIFCRQCGEKVSYKGTGAIPIFCNEKCKQKFHNTRSRRSRPPLAIQQNKNCEFCGKEFIAKKRDRRFCYDNNCPQKAYYERKKHNQMFDKKSDFECDGCGKKFTAAKSSARWCSKLCANRHWGNVRARQARSPLLDSYSDREIFDRDGWLCHICGLGIDGSLNRMSPMGATIDHVFPIAKGGLDSVDNVKAAHRSCNLAKGAKV